MSKTRITPPAPHDGRIARVRAELKKRKLDGYLIQNRMEQYWLTGFTGEDGAVLVTPDEIVLLTDGRFDQTADLEAPYARKVIRKQRTPDVTAKEIKKCKVAKLGFDPDMMNVRTFAELKKLLPGTKLTAASALIATMRQIKEETEVTAICRAIRVAEQAFKQLQTWLEPGMTERQVAARLVYEMQMLGAEEPAFGPIVAVGANGSLPHYEPANRPVTKAEGVLIDWGARVGWYVSDLTRMVWPGSIPAELAKPFETVCEAHDRAIAVIRPGVKASAVDKAARACIEKAGYGENFTHSTGHGIGLNVHEAPGLRKLAKAGEVLKPGMVVTIEPGIYLPGVGGVRVEDDVLVTETGHEVLSSLPVRL